MKLLHLSSKVNRCGIKRENIIFTEYTDKIVYLNGKDFIFHLDDDVDEFKYIIESDDDCVPINVEILGWEKKIYDLLEL